MRENYVAHEGPVKAFWPQGAHSHEQKDVRAKRWQTLALTRLEAAVGLVDYV